MFLLLLFPMALAISPLCESIFETARKHCPNTECFLREIHEEQCRRELCDFVKTIEGKQFCLYISKDYSQHLAWMSDNIRLEAPPQQSVSFDWNRVLLKCAPNKLSACQPLLSIALTMCNMTAQCIRQYLGAECETCLCYLIDCNDVGWIDDRVEQFGIRDVAPLIRDGVNLTSAQEKILERYNNDKRYSIPVFTNVWQDNIRTNIVKGYEKVSQLGLQTYCDTKIKRAWMTCGNGRAEVIDESYTNCLKSMLKGSYCEDQMCRDGYWKC